MEPASHAAPANATFHHFVDLTLARSQLLRKAAKQHSLKRQRQLERLAEACRLLSELLKREAR